jgi:hypothetical protein
MEELQWSYLAGFIDADGCISIRSERKNKFRPSVAITNSNLNVLIWMSVFVNRGCTFHHKKPSKENHKVSHDVRWSNNAALYVCEKCLPFLRIKKDRALLLINEWKQTTPRNGRYTEEMKKKKLNLIERMRGLNKRGI